jgi:glucose/arabinose dehydrogenase
MIRIKLLRRSGDICVLESRRSLHFLAGILITSAILLPSTAGCFASELSEPVLKDPTLQVENVVSGLEFPTGLAFLGPNDILVIEKNKGTVQRVVNGEVLEKPLLDLNVASQIERGMLGIAFTNSSSHLGNISRYVFLFFTESEQEDGGKPLGNRLYRYELIDNALVNPKLLLDLPHEPGPAHNGGVIAVNAEGNVYLVVGNMFSKVYNEAGEDTITQNLLDGKQPDGTGGILRITQDGELVDGQGILGEEHPLNLYYAYGIRNSFGIAFDPLTGKLWGTENGGRDEINLIEPGFNSGWKKVSGMSSIDREFDLESLVLFNGRGQYSDPELDLGPHVAPTAIAFLNSEKLGKQYQSEMFVGNGKGEIYNLELNYDRRELLLDGPLSDKVADGEEELTKIVFAENIGTITDLEVGPDGYLYGSIYDRNGGIFRILPKPHGN